MWALIILVLTTSLLQAQAQAQVTCMLNPVTNTSSLFPNPSCLVYYDSTVGATSGVSTVYYRDEGTCATNGLGQLNAPFGTCFKNYIGPQPSCDNYYNCIASSSTFTEYIDCLTPIPEFIYAKIDEYSTTSYAVYLYTDDNCSTPLTYVLIPYGCMAAPYLQDVNGTNCGLSQNIWPSNSGATLSCIIDIFF